MQLNKAVPLNSLKRANLIKATDLKKFFHFFSSLKTLSLPVSAFAGMMLVENARIL